MLPFFFFKFKLSSEGPITHNNGKPKLLIFQRTCLAESLEKQKRRPWSEWNSVYASKVIGKPEKKGPRRITHRAKVIRARKVYVAYPVGIWCGQKTGYVTRTGNVRGTKPALRLCLSPMLSCQKGKNGSPSQTRGVSCAPRPLAILFIAVCLAL